MMRAVLGSGKVVDFDFMYSKRDAFKAMDEIFSDFPDQIVSWTCNRDERMLMERQAMKLRSYLVPGECVDGPSYRGIPLRTLGQAE